MLIESTSKYYLKKIRAKAKMYEYSVPENDHIKVEEEANDLILLGIGIVGDIANEIWNMEQAPIILSKEKEEELYFVSRFFDSYFESKMSIEMSPYYILMGAVTYYFCNMNGSSKVMMSIMPQLVNYHNVFFACGNSEEMGFDEFKRYVYRYGNNREILFIDIILAILKKKIYNSCINLMPLYSKVDQSEWIATFKSNVMMKEMWKSQIILGEKGIFKGKSGVIQMPTSSGKTTSISLAIQSAFLSKRTSIVIVVAPFRALCKEIMIDIENFFEFDKNVIVTEFSDIPEPSEIELVESELIVKKVFVMTPEKLAYILKHNTEIIESINMIVFDEAHLFDDESRGTDYELLLATINNYIRPDAQKILVSAVISNADMLNSWINRDGVVINNNTIKTSEKTVAFNTLMSYNVNDAYSNLHFVDPDKNLEEEFYVPRVMQTKALNKVGKEKKQRYFPDFKSNKQDIGIYYAIKLIGNGSIAIFCTKKDIVNSILKRFIELKKKGISLEEFSTLSDETERLKIAYLIRKHLGENNLYIAALNGILGHHSGVPNGVRIAEEYALKKSVIRCVVCTSTLAQGVNLPIKYLIISSVYQSKQIIKVRDFHNLIGRTARAGKETEGTIILTEDIYNNKAYKLNNYKRLLNADNSEECSSNLLKLVRSDVLGINISNFFKKYIEYRYSDKDEYYRLKKYILIYKEQAKEQAKEQGEQIFNRMNEIDHILVSLENFILGFKDEGDESFEIIQSTYGYHLANEDEREELKNIYNLIKGNIKILDAPNRLLYRKSMLGILKMKELKGFIEENLYEIANADYDTLIKFVANILKESDKCKIIPKLIDNSCVNELLKMWIDGKSYIRILNYSKSVNLLIKRGKKSRNISLEDIITLCDSDFGYASLTIIQAIVEILNTKDCNKNIEEALNDIIYRIRYGLPNKESVYIYELGFADRIISQKIADEISVSDCSTKKKTKSVIKSNKEKLKVLLANYPSYFTDRLEKI